VVGKNQTPVAGCQVFEVIFSLLRHIDECTDDILFFADEGGSWEVGVNWKKVLPAWFRVHSPTAGPPSMRSGLQHSSIVTTSMGASRC